MLLSRIVACKDATKSLGFPYILFPVRQSSWGVYKCKWNCYTWIGPCPLLRVSVGKNTPGILIISSTEYLLYTQVRASMTLGWFWFDFVKILFRFCKDFLAGHILSVVHYQSGWPLNWVDLWSTWRSGYVQKIQILAKKCTLITPTSASMHLAKCPINPPSQVISRTDYGDTACSEVL